MHSQVPIQSSHLAGAIAINTFSALSAFALVTIMLRMTILSVRYRVSGGAAPKEYAFFSTNFGCYAACLLVASVLNTVAGLISIKWTAMQAIDNDNVCKFQVVVMQLGNWSTAYFTVAIAVHTFNSLILRIRQAGIIRDVTLVVGWAVAIIAAVVPVVLRPDNYGPGGVTCDFTTSHLRGRFLLHVLPILISSFLSAGMYSAIFLVLRGTLSIRGGFKITFDPNERIPTVGTDPNAYRQFVAKIAGAMLWFPIAYIVLLVPYSIVQLLVISGFKVPFGVLAFSFVLWFLLGIANVLLTCNIFRVLGPAIDPQSTSRLTEASLLPIYYESELRPSDPASIEKGLECGLPDDYNEIIRPSVMRMVPERPIVLHGEPALPHTKGSKAVEAQPAMARQTRSNITNQQGLPPPSRPPRPETLKLSESPPAVTPLASASTENDQSIQLTSAIPGHNPQRRPSRPSQGLRPSLSAVMSERPRTYRADLNEGNRPPGDNYI